jgi:hypothetical protein
MKNKKLFLRVIVLKAGIEPRIPKLKDLSFLTNLLQNSWILLLSS